jgi:hypothetical protein
MSSSWWSIPTMKFCIESCIPANWKKTFSSLIILPPNWARISTHRFVRFRMRRVKLHLTKNHTRSHCLCSYHTSLNIFRLLMHTYVYYIRGRHRILFTVFYPKNTIQYNTIQYGIIRFDNAVFYNTGQNNFAACTIITTRGYSRFVLIFLKIPMIDANHHFAKYKVDHVIKKNLRWEPRQQQ